MQPREAFYKKAVLKNFSIFTGKYLCWSLFLTKLQLYLKETPAQVFSCEYCEISPNIYFEERLQMATSVCCDAHSRPCITFTGVTYLKPT